MRILAILFLLAVYLVFSIYMVIFPLVARILGPWIIDDTKMVSLNRTCVDPPNTNEEETEPTDYEEAELLFFDGEEDW